MAVENLNQLHHNFIWSDMPLVDWVHDNMSVVRSCPITRHRGFKLLTYKQWFHGCDQHHLNSHTWTHLATYEQVRTVALFRLGAHWLNIERQRYHPNRVEHRNARLCKCCNLGVVEDEAHFLLYCPCYDSLRKHYPRIFQPDLLSALHRDQPTGLGSTDRSMRHIMAPNPMDSTMWPEIALFLMKARAMREMQLLGQSSNCQQCCS